MIIKVRSKWLLYTRDGKRVLGTHDTIAAAEAQERAIQISQARRAGYRIPKPPRRRRRA